jgi:hypothetical protein
MSLTYIHALSPHIDKKLMGIFRAVLQSSEKSQRVIDLTELILDENAANYTVW